MNHELLTRYAEIVRENYHLAAPKTNDTAIPVFALVSYDEIPADDLPEPITRNLQHSAVFAFTALTLAPISRDPSPNDIFPD